MRTLNSNHRTKTIWHQYGSPCSKTHQIGALLLIVATYFITRYFDHLPSALDNSLDAPFCSEFLLFYFYVFISLFYCVYLLYIISYFHFISFYFLWPNSLSFLTKPNPLIYHNPNSISHVTQHINFA